MRIKHRITIAGTAVGLAAAGLAGLTGPAQAAPPANDAIRNAIPITVPYTATVDTSEATTTRREADLCVGSHSVWYRFEPTTSGTAGITTLGSNYRNQLTVLTGPPSDRQVVECNARDFRRGAAVRLEYEADTTYWIAISSCCRRSPTGGTAKLTVYDYAPPGGEITEISAETGGVSGRLWVNLTVICDTPSLASVPHVFATQRVGANVARGRGWSRSKQCWPDQPTEFRVAVDSETGWAFQPGSPLALDGYWDAYDGISSTRDRFEETVTPTADPNARAQR